MNKKLDIIQISRKVLERLSIMGYETNGKESSERLIFPKKIQAKGTRHIDRISEQELRFLFVEEFKKDNPNLFYSIETPTDKKYSFGKSFDDIVTHENGQSAALDMCIFERDLNIYNRILNIEFKHKNTSIKNIGKDVLKLVKEDQKGVFIHLLTNTHKGKTLWNKKNTGIFQKLYISFQKFNSNWSNSNENVLLIILSLKQKTLIYREIEKDEINNLNEIFFIDEGCGNIHEINYNGWNNLSID